MRATLRTPCGANIRLLRPVIAGESSDSGKLDNQLELLVRGGQDGAALLMMIPEAWERLPEGEVTPERRAFYQYHSADRAVGRAGGCHLYGRAYRGHHPRPQRAASGAMSCWTTAW